jgi:uncharacterized cupin superfamily protein
MANELWETSLFFEAASATIVTEPVPVEQVISGQPETGSVELGVWSGKEVGVWEMTPGVMSDVEADEVCIILSGMGTVQRTIGAGTIHQELKPGVVLELRQGEETIWSVSESVRKVYLS